MDKKYLQKIKEQPFLLANYLGYKDINELQGEWIKNAYQRNQDIYCIQAHRNAYKTTSIIVVGLIWYLLFNLNKTCLIVRKEFTSASQTLSEIVKHYNSQKIKYLYHKIFGIDFYLTRQSSYSITLNTKTTISKEGNIEIAGMSSNITGRHYDVIICDDIVNLSDRYSEVTRRKTITFFDELKNIKKQNGKIIISGTPWHSEDLFSLLEKQGIQIEKYDITKTKILKKEYIEDIKKTMDLSLFVANYELKHISTTDKYFNEPKYFEEDDKIFIYTKNYALIDTAYDGENYTAISILTNKDDNIYVTGFVYRQNVYDLQAKIAKIIERYNVCKLWIESNADKGIIAKELQKRINIPIISYTETQNKHVKIITTIKKYWDKIHFSKNCQLEYLQQILEYSDFASDDDAPDSLASLLQKTQKKEIIAITGII